MTSNLDFDIWSQAISQLTPTNGEEILVRKCPGAPKQRMTIWENGEVCTRNDRVIVRSAPRRSGKELLRLKPGETFQIIGGPACADNWSWWQIEMEDGTTGWVAEGGDATDPYFICPSRY